MRIVNLKEMSEIERVASCEHGFTESLIIENVGIRGADCIFEKYLKDRYFGELVLLVGKGNNGADGLAIARNLKRYGFSVRAFLLFNFDDCSTELRIQLGLAENYGVKVSEIRNHEQIHSYFTQTQDEYFVLDAILGTGVRLPLSNFLRDVINTANEYASVMVSVDMPTGVMGDTGAYSASAISANLTLAIALPKLGHYMADVCDFIGELAIIDAGFPQTLLEGGNKVLLTPEIVNDMISSRDKFAHKYSFGHTLIVGGSTGLTGALILAANAALGVGSGLVTAVTWEENFSELASRLPPEIISGQIPVNDESSFASLDTLDRFDSVVIGPGIGKSEGARKAVLEILSNFEGPVVIDADAINVLDLEKDKAIFKMRKTPTILTPHLGEFLRLTGEQSASVRERPLTSLQKLVGQLNCACLLKGPCTYIALPNGEVYINYFPNEGMATGGSGDVLAGILGGLFAQHFSGSKRGGKDSLVSFYQAICLGVVVHSLAGKYAANKLGTRAMKAGSIVDYLSQAFSEMGEGGSS